MKRFIRLPSRSRGRIERDVADELDFHLRERAEALVAIAHPDFRAELRREVAAIRHFDLAGGAGGDSR